MQAILREQDGMLRLFISYSRLDIDWCQCLSAHLKGLGSDLLQEVWYDQKIGAGDQWIEKISDHLEAADIVLLLVTSNFIDSEFCALEVDRYGKTQAGIMPGHTYYASALQPIRRGVRQFECLPGL
jgi:hypothetical protein